MKIALFGHLLVGGRMSDIGIFGTVPHALVATLWRMKKMHVFEIL